MEDAWLSPDEVRRGGEVYDGQISSRSEAQRYEAMRSRPASSWRAALEKQSLAFLIDQASRSVRGWNGPGYDEAVQECIAERLEAGVEALPIRVRLP